MYAGFGPLELMLTGGFLLVPLISFALAIVIMYFIVRKAVRDELNAQKDQKPKL